MSASRYSGTIPGGLIVIFLVSLLAAGCASGPGPENPEIMEVTEGQVNLTTADVLEDPDRMICRRNKATGTRISEKVCMTAREWQRMYEASQRTLDTITRAPQQFEDQ